MRCSAFQSIGDLTQLIVEQSFLCVWTHLGDWGRIVLRKEWREVDFFTAFIGHQYGNTVVAGMIGIVDNA